MNYVKVVCHSSCILCDILSFDFPGQELPARCVCVLNSNVSMINERLALEESLLEAPKRQVKIGYFQLKFLNEHVSLNVAYALFIRSTYQTINDCVLRVIGTQLNHVLPVSLVWTYIFCYVVSTDGIKRGLDKDKMRLPIHQNVWYLTVP